MDNPLARGMANFTVWTDPLGYRLDRDWIRRLSERDEDMRPARIADVGAAAHHFLRVLRASHHGESRDEGAGNAAPVVNYALGRVLPVSTPANEPGRTLFEPIPRRAISAAAKIAGAADASEAHKVAKARAELKEIARRVEAGRKAGRLPPLTRGDKDVLVPYGVLEALPDWPPGADEESARREDSRLLAFVTKYGFLGVSGERDQRGIVAEPVDLIRRELALLDAMLDFEPLDEHGEPLPYEQRSSLNFEIMTRLEPDGSLAPVRLLDYLRVRVDEERRGIAEWRTCKNPNCGRMFPILANDRRTKEKVYCGRSACKVAVHRLKARSPRVK